MKIDISLTTEDKEYIERVTDDSHPIYAFLRRREQLNFNIGDVLIRKSRTWVGQFDDVEKWVVDLISDLTPAPKKYMVVHKDEFNVCYIKLLKMGGELGKTLTCLATIDLQYQKYEIDPEYIDHILLSGEDGKEFDPHERVEEARANLQKILDYNKTIMANADFYGKEPPSNLKKAMDFLKAIKPKTRFWSCYEDDTSNIDEDEVIAVGWGKDHFYKKSLVVKSAIDGDKFTIDPYDVYRRQMFFVRPVSTKEGFLE